jgi:hypothetical protein
MVNRIIAAFAVFLFAATAGAQSGPFNQVIFGGDLMGSGTTWDQQFVGPGTITLAKQANLAADSIPCNPNSSAGVQQACNPLQIANLMSGVLNVNVVSTSNITLSGTQTIDGFPVTQGDFVLVAGQTTASANGIYVAQSGAWTRAINFPSGYTIQQNCALEVIIQSGTVRQGHVYRLNTGSAIIIGTNSQAWIDASLASATSTVAGALKISQQGLTAAGVGSVVNAIGDCTSFLDLTGSVADQGNAIVVGTSGPCIVGDSNGNLLSALNSNTASVTGTGCSAGANSTNNSGSITTVGVDTCTLTFNSPFATAPFCSIGNVGPTVLAYLNALPGTGSAVFKTTAAGTFTYTCN